MSYDLDRCDVDVGTDPGPEWHRTHSQRARDELDRVVPEDDDERRRAARNRRPRRQDVDA